MSLQIFISGKYFDKENAKVSVYDHGFLYGDGVFEGMRIYGGKVFRLHEHLIRLWESASSIALAWRWQRASAVAIAPISACVISAWSGRHSTRSAAASVSGRRASRPSGRAR